MTCKGPARDLCPALTAGFSTVTRTGAGAGHGRSSDLDAIGKTRIEAMQDDDIDLNEAA